MSDSSPAELGQPITLPYPILSVGTILGYSPDTRTVPVADGSYERTVPVEDGSSTCGDRYLFYNIGIFIL